MNLGPGNVLSMYGWAQSREDSWGFVLRLGLLYVHGAVTIPDLFLSQEEEASYVFEAYQVPNIYF